MIYEFVYKGETKTVDFKDNRIATIAGGVGAPLEIEYTGDGRLLLRNGAGLKEIHAAVNGDKTYVDIDGVLFEFAKPSDAVGAGGGAGAAMTDPSKVLAPMPGKVVKILVGVGDKVEPKQHLVIVEAMKMENIIVAHAKGKVKAVNYAEGAQCDTETPIVELELDE
jgi:biotin carboxyl carrier protein